MRKTYVVNSKIVAYLELGKKNDKPHFGLDFDVEKTNINFNKLEDYISKNIKYDNIKILENLKKIIVDLNEEEFEKIKLLDYVDSVTLNEKRI